nr:ATP-binding cassette domain-containing protein [Brevibacterium ihuae]
MIPSPPPALSDPRPGLAVEAVGLRKVFGTAVAVDDIDLAIPRGGVYGILGPNGAGKTTTIRMLTTLLPIDGGRASVLGHDVATRPHDVRRSVALTGQFASLDEDLTGQENLFLLSRLFGFSGAAARARARELLGAFDLLEAADRQVKRYSGGMRRRLDIAASLVVSPELLFLDEPTTGLDPRSRNHVWDIVRSLVAAGTTVVLTTQYLDEADQLASRIAVIDHGRVVAEGTSDELKALVGQGTVKVRLADPADAERSSAVLRDVLGVEPLPQTDPAEILCTVAPGTSVAAVLPALEAAGIAISAFSLGQPSLDEVFLTLTGAPVADDRTDHRPATGKDDR